MRRHPPPPTTTAATCTASKYEPVQLGRGNARRLYPNTCMWHMYKPWESKMAGTIGGEGGGNQGGRKARGRDAYNASRTGASRQRGKVLHRLFGRFRLASARFAIDNEALRRALTQHLQYGNTSNAP
eukprot:361902-Chlamydomonas_euryale.AAC.4